MHLAAAYEASGEVEKGLQACARSLAIDPNRAEAIQIQNRLRKRQ
jgi:hypothetical protein